MPLTKFTLLHTTVVLHCLKLEIVATEGDELNLILIFFIKVSTLTDNGWPEKNSRAVKVGRQE